MLAVFIYRPAAPVAMHSAAPAHTTAPTSSASPFGVLPPSAVETATINIGNTVKLAIGHSAQQAALIVYDQRTDLNRVLTEGYRRNLPQAEMLDFDSVSPAQVLAAFERYQAGDLVVLIQSTSFRLEAFRVRIELFKRGLKVIEHVHLSRMPDTAQGLLYIDALAYDPAYYRGVGHALKARIDQAPYGVLDSGDGARLVFGSPFETAKLNIGDYSAMQNIGGQYPLGEVFTEAQDLEAVNGQVRIFVFGDTSFRVNHPATPITLTIEKGRVSATHNSTPEFDTVLELIRAHEGEVWLRELGFGMNRAFSRERRVADIGTYERMCGIHLSLGAKHGQYAKPQFRRADTRYHIDVFAITEGVYLGQECVYRDGAWQVSPVADYLAD